MDNENAAIIGETGLENDRNRRNGAGPLSGTKSAHSARALESIERRLGNYVVVSSGCWEWQGYCNQHGYGRMLVRDEGRNRLLAVHRLAYELWVGSLEDGQVAMHKCDNRRCIRPDHLRAGTQQDNIQDCVRKGRYSGQVTQRERG